MFKYNVDQHVFVYIVKKIGLLILDKIAFIFSNKLSLILLMGFLKKYI